MILYFNQNKSNVRLKNKQSAHVFNLKSVQIFQQFVAPWTI